MDTLPDLLVRFAPLAVDTAPERHVRGLGLAVAQELLIRLPAGPERDSVLERLADVVNAAAEVAATR